MLFAITIKSTERLIRATSIAAARVRAYKAFGERPDHVEPVDNAILADVGCKGYDKACNTSEYKEPTDDAPKASPKLSARIEAREAKIAARSFAAFFGA